MNLHDSSEGLVIILTTEINSSIGDGLAEEILKRKLAACVSMRDAKSYFFWEGKLEKTNEVQLLIKTREGLLDALIKAINQLHSYQTPEILFWKASSSLSYGNWLEDCISGC